MKCSFRGGKGSADWNLEQTVEPPDNLHPTEKLFPPWLAKDSSPLHLQSLLPKEYRQSKLGIKFLAGGTVDFIGDSNIRKID